MSKDDLGAASEFQEEFFAPVVGQKANGCWLGYGSTLFLEFGERLTAGDLKNRKSGEWSMQCGSVLWRIEHGDCVLAGSEDDRSVMEAAIDQINGQPFMRGTISHLTGDSTLEFASNIVLRTFVLTSEEDARWSLRRGAGEFQALGPNLATNSEGVSDDK
jgi:hypothetical protein